MNILWDIVHTLNILFIGFILFFERKESARRMAWLLTLVLLPGIGMILYLLFSGHFFTRTKRMSTTTAYINEKLKNLKAEQLAYLKERRHELPNHVIKDYFPLVDMNLSKGGSLLTATDSIEIYRWGQDMFTQLKKDLQAAERTINMEFFIFHNDATGCEIMEILCRKAREGVDVKLLYDDFGSISTPTGFFRKLDKAGGKSLAFFPVRRGLPFSINFRNHRKITVIDGTIAYMGGVNVGDEYANRNRSNRKPFWRDTHIRFTGTSVVQLQTVFCIDWFSMPAWKTRLHGPEDTAKYFPPNVFSDFTQQVSVKEHPDIFDTIFSTGKIPTQIVTAGPDDIQKTEIEDALIRMIMSAKKYVYIQTPYFTPDAQFFTALRIAAFSGVDVRIMVPGVWDKFYVKAASHEFMREMLALGIKFYQYNGFIHSKTMVVDRKIATVGSTNIDTRSFELHFEVNAIFYDAKLALTCEKIFLDDIKNAAEASKGTFDNHFILKRAWRGFCKLFSPLM
ncbi:cardiolipin synthase [Treponema brennaborense]|uniref:Cardiolipin synthase n=1 Tax=Treponema brennaborense (strain DSM 12168 / CIP 105900 / DD5/3) TaxID=906968 RepID=F4LIP6_TREBD|nr:cardiolipin synthase [Treponema brennaborense]AEE16221.1 phospholipase D/Transphosphatidylase [Treponema brennaborense DSM 12168]